MKRNKTVKTILLTISIMVLSCCLSFYILKEFHPDKLSGMSQGIQDLAKEKFQLIQEAYEYLNKNYV